MKRAIRTRSVLALLLAGLVAVPAGVLQAQNENPFDQPENAPREATTSLLITSDSSAESHIRAALDQQTSIDFYDVPLTDVVEYLSMVHNIPIIIDTRSLDDVGMGSDTPVTRQLEGITLRSALRIMLKDLELTYLIRDEVLQITTPEEAEFWLITRIYLVDDLLPGAGISRVAYGHQDRASELVRAITSTIEPDSWELAGGPGSATWYEHLGLLLISQTDTVHEEITDLLDAMRRARVMATEETGGGPRDPFARGEAPFLRVYRLVPEIEDDDLRLVEFIRHAVGEESWEERSVAIAVFSGSLAVRQTRDVHLQIEELLNDLELLRRAGRETQRPMEEIGQLQEGPTSARGS